jgi:hypothetical protein
MAKVIFISKKDGEIQYKESVFNQLKNAFETISNGEHIITISKKVKKRSLDQNALMWLWFTCIQLETGTNKNDIHDYYCNMFLSRKSNVNGKEVTVTSGTSKLNTDQFTYFLNQVQADAASEFGIKLPNPDDLNFESFKQEYQRYINN